MTSPLPGSFSVALRHCLFVWATIAFGACAPAPVAEQNLDSSLSLEQVAERLQLAPHPEGGYFRQIYKAELAVDHEGIPPGESGRRPASTAIYFLIGPESFSAFHRIKWTDEVWHFYAGDPVEQHVIHSDGRYESWILDGDLDSAAPVGIVPGGVLQAARLAPGGAWALVGCTVSPGFDYADWELPTAEDLIALHPEHEVVIRELTRH